MNVIQVFILVYIYISISVYDSIQPTIFCI